MILSETSVGATKLERRFLFVLMGTCLLLVALLEVTLSHGDTTRLVLTTLCGVPAACFLLWVAAAAIRRLDFCDVFSPMVIFPIGYIVWFSIGSFDFLEVPSSYSFGAFDPIPARMWFYYAIGLVAYMAGCWIIVRRQNGRGQSPILPSTVVCLWQKQRSVLVFGALGITLLMSYTLLVSRIGVPMLQPDPYLTRLQIGGFRWTQLFMIGSGYTLPPLMTAYLWTAVESSRVRFFLGSIVLSSLCLLVSLGGRGFVFQPLLTIVVARHYLKKSYKPAKFVAALLSLFVLMSVFGFVRDYGGLEGDSPVVSAGFPPYLFPFAYAYLYVRYSVATFRDVVSVIPSSVPFQHGWLTFQPLEVLLPGHHQSSDFFFKVILGNDFEGAGQPATLLGPFYGDFGIPGVILGMLAFGMLSMYVYQWMRRTHSVVSILIYAWVVRTAIFALFITVFVFPTDLWIPLFWLVLDGFLCGSTKISAPIRRSLGTAT